MAVAEDTSAIMIDEVYEFTAPRFYDFINGETEEDMRTAELWFDNGLSYAPSPFMPKIKTGRSIMVETLCDFSEAEQLSKESDSHSSETNPKLEVPSEIKDKEEPSLNVAKDGNSASLVDKVPVEKGTCEVNEKKVVVCTEENTSSVLTESSASASVRTEPVKELEPSMVQACTPKPMIPRKVDKPTTDSKKYQTAKKIASLVRNPSALKSKNQSQLSQAKNTKLASVKRDTNVKNIAGTPNYTQENQAIKRQKLEGGKTRQILNVKPQNLPHKLRPGLNGNSKLHSSTANSKEDRKVYVREPAAPPATFVSTAEMMKKFQSNTRELSMPRANGSISHDAAASLKQRKPKLTLTRPKDPELETAQRVRSVRMKSTAELEEEMMAKIPKFKARPVNKKIMEASTLPSLPRSTPQLPEFREFHLETMARANQNAETSTVASTESSRQNHPWKFHLTEPKTPLLQTSLRARPPRVKSSFELELEEVEKAPKFKARPLNKKIFESKGEMGMFCNTKKQVTIPQEFHFATDERMPPPATVFDLFDKLSLNSEPCHDHQYPRLTTPNPFHLHTEYRGAEKERKFEMEVMQKQLEEERARNRKANPYPYTTDYPVIPPKPEPKQWTKPEPFQLESLVRHEEEMQREMEERRRKEKEEADMRLFKAQPILKEDPIPVPEKTRIPLTEVQEFNLHVEHRAVDRAEFDKKIKEKEMMYKRYREESESAKMMEEEKALKQMRRTMVPHARPAPKFDHPFVPQKSLKEITKPKSPNLRIVRRKERRTMIAATMTAASSAASHMR